MARTVVLIFALLGAQLAGAQEAQAEPQDSEGREVLRRLDRRLYRATRAGLNALSFIYRPRLEGAETPDFRVRYTWREGAGDRIDFLDDAGARLEKPPTLPGLEELHRLGRIKEEPGVFLTRQMLTASRGLGLSARGMNLIEDFSDFRVRVHRKTVNHEEWVSLVLEPRHPKKLRRLTITLDRHGLPWQWERRLLDGGSILQHHTYKPRGDQWILAQMQETVTPRGQTTGIRYAYDISFQKVQGIVLPASIKKAGASLPEWARGRTELTDMKVNDDVPAFVAM